MNAFNSVEELYGDVSTGIQGFFEHILELLYIGTPFLAEIGGEDANK